MIQLDNPELGTQRERNPDDAYVRNYNVLKHYAQANNFEAELDAIMARHGGGPKQLSPRRLKVAIDTAQVELQDEIEAGREGTMPFTKAITYEYIDTDGRRAKFVLDPDIRAHRTLQQFEVALSKHPNQEAMIAQFMPAFREIRQSMVSDGWDEKESSPQATLLAIKQLCDTWAS